MSVQKKVVIAYIVGGVGLTGGVAGLVIGLTRKPADPTETHTLTLEYNSEKDSQGTHTEIKKFTAVSKIDKELAETIADLPYDDVYRDTDGDEHHFRTFDKLLASNGDVIYDKDNVGDFHDYVLTGDTTVYVATERSHYHVYLCYEDSSELLGMHVYNPNDWYPTKEYDPHTIGFTERGEVEHHDHEQFLGWQLNTSPKASPITELGVLPSEAKAGQTQKTDENGNHWPVVPGSVNNNTGKLDLTKDLFLHPIYEYVDAKITFDADGGLEVPDKWAAKGGTLESVPTTTKEHMTLDHWVYSINPPGTHKIGEPVNWSEAIHQDFGVKAVWKEAAWTVSYYGADDEVIESHEYQTTIYNGQFEGTNPSKGNYYFLGWNENKGATTPIDLTKPITITKTTDLYPVFVESNFKITLDPNGGHFIKQGQPSSDAEIINTIKGTTFTTVKDLVTAAGCEDLVVDDEPRTGRKLIAWVAWQQTDYLVFPYTISESTVESGIYLMAIYANPHQFLVTFDASPGWFTYYDSYGTQYGTTTLSYVVDTLNYSSDHPCNVKNVYADALKSKEITIEGVTHPCTLSNDGYILNSEEKSGYKFSGWTYSGAPIVEDYPLGSATAFTADWKLKEANNFWTDDWGTIIYYANQGFNTFKENYKDAYYSEKSFYDGATYSGSKYGDVNEQRGSFVGLERNFELVDYGTFRTRIIGQSQDVLADGSGDNALFTFDFVQCPMTGSIGSSSDYLNGYVPNNYAPLLRGAMSSTLRQNLQIVTKPILQVNSAGTVSATTDNEYIFAASAYEVNGGITQHTGSGVTNSSAYDESKYSGTWGSLLFRYNWYEKTYDNVTQLNNRTISDRSSDVNTHYRAKTYTNNEGETSFKSWILRTPVTSYKPWSGAGTNNCSFYVCDNHEATGEGKPYLGGIYEYYSSDTRGFSPCFCLGVQSAA